MSEYQVGGSLRVDANTYVSRNADRQLYQGLLAGEFCYVFNCRQMGKSSLRVRVKNRLEQQGYACVSLDMTNIGSQSMSPLQWYKSIASEIWRGLNLIGRVSLKKWWSEHAELSPIQHLNLFIEDVILTEVAAERIVIFIDEIDSVLSLDFATDDFFALIRYFYNARADRPIFNRLTFALFGVATPTELIEDSSRTPFNIGTAIALTGFELEAAKPLIAGLNDMFQYPEAVLAEILHWTGGQPFLTQKLCQVAVKESQSISYCEVARCESDWIEQIARAKIIDNWESQDEPEHLKTIRDRLLGNEQSVSRLLSLTEQILLEGSILADDSREQRQLLLTNLVVKRNNRLYIRNPIYQHIFNLDWIYQQSDKLCPYSREVKLWCASQQQDSSRLLRGRALLEAQTWANKHNISQSEYQFLSASQKQEQSLIQQNLELKRLKEVETRLINEQKLARSQRFLLSTVGAALAITSFLSIAAYRNFKQAQRNEIRAEKSNQEALVTSSESLFNSQQTFFALIEALKAWKNRNSIPDSEVKSQVNLALEQAVKNVVEKNTFSGHQDVVNGISYSQDGKLIATASSDNTVKIWQRNGKLLKTLTGHLDSVIDVAFNPQADLLASASEDNRVNLWDSQGRLVESLYGHRGSVHRVIFNPQGNLLASASEDRTVRLWNLQGELVSVLAGHQKEILAVAFSRDGQTVATGDRAGIVRLWNLQGQKLREFSAHTLSVRGIDFSPDGEQLVTGGDDNVAKIWSVKGRLQKTLKGYEAPVTGVKFSPDGRLIGTSSWDKSIKIWHRSGDLYSNLLGHQGRVWRLAWSPDSQEIATAGWDNVAKIWQIADPLVQNFYGHQATVLSVAFQPQGNLISSSSDDRTVKLWNLDGTLQANFTDYGAETYEAVFSHDGNFIASTSLDRQIELRRIDGTLLKTFTGHEAPVVDVDFLNDDLSLVSAGFDKTIRLWNLKRVDEGIEVSTQRRIFAHQAIITDIDASRDGELIATVSHDRHLKLWKYDGKLIKDIVADKTGLNAVVVSPDSQIIATGGKDQQVKFWSRDGILLQTFNGHQSVILDIEFSPDGKLVASASADRTIKIWDRQGKLLTTLQGHQGRVWDIAFSPDGEKLVSGAEDKLIKLWDLKRILQLNPAKYGCAWVADYLNTNATVIEEGDLDICS
ncbi:MAG: AAA-like domain-containing protein [Cyanobacteria bacterium J06623_7]